jgi:hypothetical protein
MVRFVSTKRAEREVKIRKEIHENIDELSKLLDPKAVVLLYPSIVYFIYTSAFSLNSTSRLHSFRSKKFRDLFVLIRFFG